MLRWSLLVLLVAGCTERTLWVGVNPRRPFDAADGARDSGTQDLSPVDAGGTLDAREASEPVDAAPAVPRCVVLPDIVAANVTASVTRDGVQTSYFLSNETCGTSDAGLATGSYAFERTDDQPLLRGGRHYLFRWPPEGRDAPAVIVTGALSAGNELCEVTPLLHFQRGAGERGCANIQATADATMLVLEAPTLLGLFGAVEFELCEGACPL